MIEFKDPPIQLSLQDYMELVELWKSAGSCAGFCISLGHQFFSEGVVEVDGSIMPTLSAAAASNVSLRVLPSYATLFWFACKVSIYYKECGSLHLPHSLPHS